MSRPQWPVRGAAAGLVGSAALIAALTVVARLVGFGRVFVFAGAVGRGCTGSVYTVTNQLPNVLFEVAAGGALAGAVVPVLAAQLAGGREQDADRTASALLCWAVVLLVPLAVLLALLARPITAALLSGRAACDGGAQLGARMLVVFAPQVVLYGLGIVLAGVLQARRRFAWPALAPLLSSLVVIASYVIYGLLAGAARGQESWLPDPWGEAVLSGGTTLGVVALSLPLLWPVLRSGARLRPTLHFPPGVAARVRGLALAGVAALLAQQSAVVVSLVLATRVGGQGAPVVVQYAQTVYLVPYAVLAVPLATAALPRLAAQAALDDRSAFAATAARSTRFVLLAGLLGTGLLLACAPAAQALFSAVDVVGGGPLPVLSASVAAFAPGLVGWCLVAHLSRALYADGRARAAATATANGWALAIGASLASVAALSASGHPGPWAAAVGIGVGSSVGMTLAGALLLHALWRAAGAQALDGVLRGGLLAAVAAGAAAVLGRLVADALLGAPAHPASNAGSHAALAWRAVGSAGVAALVVVAVFVGLLATAGSRGAAGLPRRGAS